MDSKPSPFVVLPIHVAKCGRKTHKAPKCFRRPHYIVFCILTGWRSGELGSKKHAQLVMRYKLKQKDYLKLYRDASADEIQRKRNELCTQLLGWLGDDVTVSLVSAYS